MKIIYKNVLVVFLCLSTFFQMKELTSDISFSRKFDGRNSNSNYKATFYPPVVEFQNKIGNTTTKILYTNLFVLELKDNKDEVKRFVENRGFVFIRKVFEDGNYYLFRHDTCSRKCRRGAKGLLKNLTKHTSVKWAEQQTSLKRVTRTALYELLKGDIYTANLHPHIMKRNKINKDFHTLFDDPLFEEQWYLLNQGQTGSPPENDINVFPVWRSGITGKGVRISVLDDGIHPGSEEVADNYDFISSADFSYMHKKYTPVPENSHGTYCAAIAAGVANNRICGVGVAYDAKIGGVRILDGPVTDAQEAMALVHALNYVHIYTASWGPNDDGKHIAGPGVLAKLAFIKGISEGRDGKGAIYVWAAGNGGRYLDNCNLDGYASSPFTVTIGALTADGYSTYYSEPCAAVIASVYIGGSHLPPSARNIWEENRKIKVVVPEGRGKCRETFQGTSAAAPMAAGVVALALQANPDLSWRDVQHIIVRTSQIPTSGEVGWTNNAAGHHFHLKIGFGVLNAEKMVQAALKWQIVLPLIVWTSLPVTDARIISPNDVVAIPLLVQKSTMDPLQRVDHLESVIATINIVHPQCGDLEMFLVSPSGTLSQILTRRPYDDRNKRLPHWEFLTLHFWDEDPDGWWTLTISNRGSVHEGMVDLFSLTLHGTMR